MQPIRLRTWASSIVLSVPLACGSGENDNTSSGEGSATGGSLSTGGASSGSGGSSPIAGGGAPTSGVGGSNVGGNSGVGGGLQGTGGGLAGTGGTLPEPPATCAEAAAPFTVTTSPLAGNIVPAAVPGLWGGRSGSPRLSVSSAADGRTYVGTTVEDGSGVSVKIALAGSESVITIPGAVLGGIAATNDGVAALLYDPGTADERVWTAVHRFDSNGSPLFSTELFHSPNLEDLGTKGEPSRGRLGYVESTDNLVAYFGHTERNPRDGVRHQGGYLASVDASGEQTALDDWFGSHNLDQRLLITGDRTALLGLGDAFPQGIFFAYAEPNARPTVIYLVATAGNGAAAAQLGGMTEVDDVLVMSFVTDRSVPQDLDAGEWPDIDPTVSERVRDAAANGTDLGLLLLPKDASPAPVEPVWVDLAPAAGARITALKTTRYGAGDLLLLAWAETTGERSDTVSTAYTQVIDRAGAICQAKQAMPSGFMQTDDVIRRSDGTIVWANADSGSLSLVTLVPE